jgi:cyclopropane fatty-acyl-phospholipid synthase-like methyltransferase
MSTNIYQDGTYLERFPDWLEQDSPFKAKQVIKMIKKNDLKPSSICEVGCGAGEILNQLSDNLPADISFVGYDISQNAFEISSKKSKENLNFYLKDFTHEKNISYDIVMVMDVVEHVEDCYGFLREIREKGKFYIFHIPLDLSVLTVLRSKLIENRDMSGHIHYFTKETALASVKETGYKIIDYFYTGMRVEMSNRGWRAKLLKLPRKLLFSMSEDLTVRILGGYSLLVLAKTK